MGVAAMPAALKSVPDASNSDNEFIRNNAIEKYTNNVGVRPKNFDENGKKN
jgi:hypothetical protein